MSDQLFNDSSTVGTTAEIPDIFDVLEGGEDEGAVRYLLGFNGEEGSVGLLGQVDSFGGMEVIDKYVGEAIPLPINGTTTNFVANNNVTVASTVATTPSAITVKSPVTVRQQVTTSVNNSKKRDTSGAKAIHNCDSCGKCFTTKFNLKRHINMHCHKSKENGVPIQGPPSASAPAKKSEKQKGDRPQEANKEGGKDVVQVTTGPPQQTVLAQNQTTIIQRPTVVPVPYTRVVTVPQTEYQRPEPDSTYKLPSVQTILPVYTSSTTIGTTTYSTIASCDSSQPVPSVTSSSHNTDYGTLPADLFDPDSSQSQSSSSPAVSPPHSEESPSKPDKELTEGSVAAGGGGSPQPVTLTTVPSGWTRKLSTDTGRVIFISPLGKVFSCHDEIVQYFKGFNFNVPLGLFDFDPRFLEDSDDDDEEETDEEDAEEEDVDESEGEEGGGGASFCAKRRRSEMTVMESPTTKTAVVPPTTTTGPTPSNSPLA